MPQKLSTTETFKQRVFDKHGNKVEILSEYKGGTEPIDLVYHCEKHGDVYKTIHAKNILAKSFQPCSECNSENKSNSSNRSESGNKIFYYNKLKKYVEDKGGKLHSPKWTFAKDIYEIECENGHIFHTNADSLVNKPQWCPYCYGRKGNFEEEINDIVKSKNGELLSHYINSFSHVKVKCNTHNYEWDIMPLNIKKGRWCPVCNMNFSEKVMYDYLINQGYNIRVQYTFNDLKTAENEFYRFDFAILDANNELLRLIEVDGDSHIYDMLTIANDKVKNDYCSKNKIKLFRLLFNNNNKKFLDYDWYYSYINTQLYTYIIDLKAC